ncbi:DUF3037 domain-containing protein [Burkholderia pseudomallei]|uniref:DUF3037 domain-containing protein n=1 Tax=Burkholderia pseudomallei TaxID=28450 RepID=UPI00053219C3|nr:DUF3037 domain-containing protein [Burkholderia pseudomallei]KGS32018.1 hypothetical protein X989_6079 [Burkholderia pseudomallei MSHR4378]MBF3659669.1 DUF3037 domain-containing protein [Burkholderia pseudomallei]MBF3700125.1 DUF3037 domain-containing protein [Burkholderia pseudomallei]MBF3725085.1 DUF3037 domain-containing protein [Burkholderia pseudomallei]CAJ3520039.1 Protein of uncharacterised function (DUF3037) [Burkholderia pseudomallei]
MKHPCRYALIRFMPYAQTGEFANVGIVLMSPTARFFGYKLMDRVVRITAFFDDLDAGVYKHSRDVFRDELDRISSMVQRAFIGAVGGHTTDFANHAFDELVKVRQAIIYADSPRAALIDDPKTALDNFYEHYVGRSFVTPQNKERLVEQRVRGILRAADLQRLYAPRVLGEDYQARLPFVRLDEQQKAIKLIKPLDLDRRTPTALYDHGWEWLGKILKLRKDGQFDGDVLFAVHPPKENCSGNAVAYAQVKAEFERAEIHVAEDNDRKRILEFAE